MGAGNGDCFSAWSADYGGNGKRIASNGIWSTLHQLLNGLTEQLETFLTQNAGKTVVMGEQAAAPKLPASGGLPITAAGGQQTDDSGMSPAGGRQAGTSGQTAPLPQGAATTPAGAGTGAAPMSNSGEATDVRGGMQTSTGTGPPEAGIKSGDGQAEMAGKVGQGIQAGTGIPGESQRSTEAGRPGIPGAAADVAAGRGIAGQQEGSAAGRPDGRAETPAAASASPAAAQTGQQHQRRRSWRRSCWPCWTRSASTAAPAQPGAAAQAALHLRAARRRLPAACRSLCQPALMRSRLEMRQHLRALPHSTRLSPTRGPVGGARAEAARCRARAAGSARAAQARVGEAASPGTADSLKGLLLQLASSDSAPAALKEAAGQAVQYLTGQQLLLTTDRGSTFAQMHWFIPITGPNGEETASVQIQSRRGQRGELDASNCRLWFDLDMKSLGQHW